jgi:uncharacterized membrane protein
VDIVQAVAAWLHSLATVILLGYYALLALVVVPVLRRAVDAPTLGRVIPAVERRALPLILASIGVFLVTGMYMLFTDDRFLGVGHFFGGAWSTLIVIKHVVVVVLIGISVYIDLLVVPDIATPVDEVAQTAAVRRLARSASVIATRGAVVLLLTAAAQAS